MVEFWTLFGDEKRVSGSMLFSLVNESVFDTFSLGAMGKSITLVEKRRKNALFC